MSASKDRLRWNQIPAPIRAEIEQLLGGTVITARNCPGGFSPGFASRLTLTDGRRVFVKAMDADAWPEEAMTHRTEAVTTAALPATAPAPQFLGTFDNDHWVALAFEDIDGAQPPQPWNPTDLGRVAAAVGQLARAVTPSPITLPHDHPRLGGWAELAHDRSRLTQLPDHSRWAANNIAHLIRLEEEGLAAAQGPSLVHFDLYPHNILLTPRRVLFIDWPHARLGTPVVDLVVVLSSAAADRIDPEPILRNHAGTTEFEPGTIDAILAAHAGFLLNGGLSPTPPGLEPITKAKLHLGHGAVNWLQQRLTNRT
ncbi:MAG: hypothetical protein V7603_5719 [Micromonosporaceae bacterium]